MVQITSEAVHVDAVVLGDDGRVVRRDALGDAYVCNDFCDTQAPHKEMRYVELSDRVDDAQIVDFVLSSHDEIVVCGLYVHATLIARHD